METNQERLARKLERFLAPSPHDYQGQSVDIDAEEAELILASFQGTQEPVAWMVERDWSRITQPDSSPWSVTTTLYRQNPKTHLPHFVGEVVQITRLNALIAPQREPGE